MLNSIKYFEEKCINRFEELENNFFKEPTKIAEYVYALTEELHKLGLEMIKDSLEAMDIMLRESQLRKQNWHIEAKTDKQITTSLGDVTFKKTLFHHKTTGEYVYLLDKIMGIAPNQRMTDDAVANLLEEAVQTSYRRGGEECSLMTEVTKQSVKNKLHSLKFPKNEERPENKKKVEYLYIEADEDHVSLQFREKKGDLVKNENNQKNNCLITKLVYIHEGIKKEAPQSNRHCLVNPYYFCGVNTGKGNIQFWNEIYEYIVNHYDLDSIKAIYVNSDGGAWIKTGIKQIAHAIHVLDEFHLEKYLTKLTSHMLDSKWDAKYELRKVIRKETKKEFNELVDCLEEYPQAAVEGMETARKYILDNWTAARLRLQHKAGVVGSSTEGHVSHVLSERMSTKAMGWSTTGAEKMAQLRAYKFNRGDMLELVRYQKKDFPKVVGSEYDVLSSTQILSSESRRHGELGKYLECMKHSMSVHSKKTLYFNSHLWGL